MKSFSEFYNQPPEFLGEQDIINYLDYWINVKKLCRGTVNYINSTLKFFYLVTLEGTWSDLRVPRLRYDKKPLSSRCIEHAMDKALLKAGINKKASPILAIPF